MAIAVEDASTLPSPVADQGSPSDSSDVAARCKDPEQVNVCRDPPPPMDALRHLHDVTRAGTPSSGCDCWLRLGSQ